MAQILVVVAFGFVPAFYFFAVAAGLWRRNNPKRNTISLILITPFVAVLFWALYSDFLSQGSGMGTAVLLFCTLPPALWGAILFHSGLQKGSTMLQVSRSMGFLVAASLVVSTIAFT